MKLKKHKEIFDADTDCVIPLHFADYVDLFNGIFGHKSEYDKNIFIKFSSEDIQEIEEQYNCKVCISVSNGQEQPHAGKKIFYGNYLYSLKFATPEDKMVFQLKFM